MENARHAFRKSMRQVCIAIGTATVNPKLLTAAKRLQYEGYLRREAVNAVIRGFVGEGISIKEIAHRTGTAESWFAVSSLVSRPTSFGAGKLPWNRISLGLKRNGTPDCGTALNFGGGLRVVTEWATRRRRAEKAENGLGHAPAARTIIRLMTLERNNLTKTQTMTVAAIEEMATGTRPGMSSRAFHRMLRSKSKDDLEAWIDRAARSLVASFANGVIRDWEAARTQ